MKKPVLLVSTLAPVFFIVMWLSFPYLNDLLLNRMKSALRLVDFSSSKMNILLTLRLKTAASFGVLPLFSSGIFILVRKIKNPGYAGRKLMLNLGLLFAAYFMGFFAKYQVLYKNLEYTDAHPLSRSIGLDTPIDSIYYYDYAVVFSLITGLFLFLLVKRRRNSDELLDEVSG